MPVFDYRCSDCGTTYDVYHKVKEIAEDVICPHCGSFKHKKLMSAPSFTIGSSSASSSNSAPPCETGEGCCGGSCSLN